MGNGRNTFGRGLSWWRYVALTNNTRHILINGEALVPPGGAGVLDGRIVLEGFMASGAAAGATSYLAFYCPTGPAAGALGSGTQLSGLWAVSNAVGGPELTIVEDDINLAVPFGKMIVADAAALATGASFGLFWGRFEMGGQTMTLADRYTVT